MRAGRRLPLRTRLAVLAAASVTVAVAAMAVAAYLVLRAELHRELDLGLTRDANRITLQLRQDGWDPALGADCSWLAAPSCAQVIGAGQGATLLPVPAEARAVAAGTRDRFVTDVEGRPLRMLTVPVRPGEALQVAVRTDRVRDSLDRIEQVLLLAVAGGAVLACGLGYVVSRAGLRPLARITAASREIARTGDPTPRIAAHGRDELAELARNFNTMLAALEESLAAQRRLVADASHELRTPLTALRSDIDLLGMSGPLAPEQRERILRRIHDQFAELTDLVTDLIELARGDEPAAHTEDVRLDELVAHCLGTARRQWPRITFEARLEPVTVTGTPDRLARAVANLLDNAAKFGQDGGAVTVVVEGRELSVRDEGSGIAAADLPRIFDRFYRAEATRALPGSGLGLAIVAQVVRAHGAEIGIESPESGGTLCTVRFSSPSHPPSPPCPA